MLTLQPVQVRKTLLRSLAGLTNSFFLVLARSSVGFTVKAYRRFQDSCFSPVLPIPVKILLNKNKRSI